jgi:serine protease Do
MLRERREGRGRCAPRRTLARWGEPARLALAAMLALGCRERAEGRDGGAAGATAPVVVATASTVPAPTLTYPSGSLVETVAAARSAVVGIRAKTPVKSGPAAMLPGASDAVADVALGTGFLIEAREPSARGGDPDGAAGAAGARSPGGIDAKGRYVLTTDRIAGASAELVAAFADGSELPAKVVGRDGRLDVALLSVDVSSLGASAQLRSLPLGDSDQLAVGERLIVLGNPFGDEVTAAAGVVSATGRDAAAATAPGFGGGFRAMLQTDARVHRGNSGGPALNAAGQVVGMAVATSERPTELSFVVPINRVREVLDSLRERGGVTRSWLGAMVKPVTAQLASSLRMTKVTGALITQLVPSSPAAGSALRVGDVVLRWGDREVDHRSLPWLVAGSAAGRPVRVTVWRGGTAVELSVTTAPMPQ